MTSIKLQGSIKRFPSCLATSRNYPERYIDYNDYKNKITDYINFRDLLHDYITKILDFLIWLQNYVTICYKLQM